MFVWSGTPFSIDIVYASFFVTLASAAMSPNDSLSSVMVMYSLDDEIDMLTLFAVATPTLFKVWLNLIVSL